MYNVTRRAALVSLAIVGAVVGPLQSRSQAADDPVVVFAAASLKSALDEVAVRWQATSGKTTTISYAASSALAKQIAEGAPADVFISADLAWMDDVSEKGLIKADTRTELLGNRIVLIAPADSGTALDIAPGIDLAAALAGGKLAMADPDAVPAGKYGKAALQSLGAWDSVAGSVAAAENVRVALALVALGEAPLGIVYETDAAAEPKVKVVGTFPAESHPPIVYPAAVTAASKNADAEAFFAFLRSDEAKAAFSDVGFSILP